MTVGSFLTKYSKIEAESNFSAFFCDFFQFFGILFLNLFGIIDVINLIYKKSV